MASLFRNINADNLFRSTTNLMSKFFSKGWGEPNIYWQLESLLNMVRDQSLVKRSFYKDLEKTNISVTKGKFSDKDVELYRGEFISPLVRYLKSGLPPESEKAHFQMILPKHWKTENKPICIHLAGTGDHYFWRRRHFMAMPLAKEHSIGSIILENPFYGHRKPKQQVRSSVNHVSDIFVMGAALLMEVVTLFLWLRKKEFGPFGLTGISMGGHMATISSSGWFEPIALVPCLSWSSAAPAFTEGVLSRGVQWEILERQLNDDARYERILRSDSTFKQLLKSHYVSDENSSNNIASTKENSDEVNILEQNSNEISRYNQVYQSFVNLLSSLQLKSYMDLKGKKIGPYALEIDVWKYLDSIPKHLITSTTNKINLDYLREISWLYDSKAFNPSKETVAFMTAIMDQCTHLSHFNKPHSDTVIKYIVAAHDRYIPREYYHVTPKDIWKQTEVEEIDCGHVIAALQRQQDFRKAIVESFDKLQERL